MLTLTIHVYLEVCEVHCQKKSAKLYILYLALKGKVIMYP